MPLSMHTFMQTIIKRKTQECSLVSDNEAGQANTACCIRERHHPGQSGGTAALPSGEHKELASAAARLGERSAGRAPPASRPPSRHSRNCPALPAPQPTRAGLPTPTIRPRRLLREHFLPTPREPAARTHPSARWFLPGPGVPPSRPPGGWFLPGPIISALPNSRLPPLRENTRPTIWRLTKQLQRRLPQSAALRFPPRRLAHGRSSSAPSPCAEPGLAARPPSFPSRLRTDRPARPPRRPPGFTHVVGAAERG